MKNTSLLGATGVLAITLASCQLPAALIGEEPIATENSLSSAFSESSSEDAASVQRMTLQGLLEEAGLGFSMEGSHLLRMDDDNILLLKGDTAVLESHIGETVIVRGQMQPLEEGGGMIMTVENIVSADDGMDPEVLVEEGTESSESSAMEEESSSSSVASSSSAVAGVPASSSSFSSSRSSSSVIVTASSDSSVPVAVDASSSTASSVKPSASVQAMAKAGADTFSYTQKYCSSHIGFCVPLHKYWFYQSFGSNVSPYPWHVEVSDQAVENAGDGLLIVNLVSGGLDSGVTEGVAVEQGDFVVAQRQWTGNRHFEISAPKELKAAVEYMANGIEVYSAE